MAGCAVSRAVGAAEPPARMARLAQGFGSVSPWRSPLKHLRLPFLARQSSVTVVSKAPETCSVFSHVSEPGNVFQTTPNPILPSNLAYAERPRLVDILQPSLRLYSMFIRTSAPSIPGKIAHARFTALSLSTTPIHLGSLFPSTRHPARKGLP
jgi:hypothetical protein